MSEPKNETQILRAALLWMRNQYDVGKPEHKEAAIDRIDAVLRDYEPTLAGMAEFREAYREAGEMREHA